MNPAAVFLTGFFAGVFSLVFGLSWAAWCAFKPVPKSKSTNYRSVKCSS